MTKTIEEIVGEDYYSVSTSLDGTKFGFVELARHIRRVLGANQWHEPIWRIRVFPDGKIVELDKFEEYLLKPVREGFGLESLYALHSAMLGIGREGKDAIDALCKEIPDWKERIKDESVKLTAKEAPKQTTLSEAMQGNSNAKKDRENSSNDVTAVFRGNDASYLASRIKRDRPDIAQRLERGEFKSIRAAAIKAGIVKVPSQLEIAKRTWNRMNESERQSFKQFIEEK